MSTDYEVICLRCMLSVHLGQRSAGVHSFGYGWNDAEGREITMKFIDEHYGHGIVINCIGDLDGVSDECNREMGGLE